MTFPKFYPEIIFINVVVNISNRIKDKFAKKSKIKVKSEENKKK